MIQQGGIFNPKMMIKTISIRKQNAGGKFEEVAFIEEMDYDYGISHIVHDGQIYNPHPDHPPLCMLDTANKRVHVVFFTSKVEDISTFINGDETLYKKTKGLQDHKVYVQKNNTTKSYKRGDVGYKQVIKSLHRNFLDKLNT